MENESPNTTTSPTDATNPQASPPHPIKTPQPKSNVSLVALLVVLALILTGITIYFAYQSTQAPTPDTPTPQAALPTTQPTTPPTSPMSDWQTYSGTFFSLKYPPLWELSNNNLPNPDDIALTTADKSRGFSININMPGIGGECLETSDQEESFIINGTTKTTNVLKGLDQDECENTEDRLIIIMEDHNGSTFHFFFSYKANDEDVALEEIRQILSTFQFTDQTESAAQASGRTCTSTNLGISVTMPNQSWQCTVDNLGVEQKGMDGTITATSPVFDVRISTLGRGDYCNSPNTDESCTSEPFYSNDVISVELWKSYQENKEIFGSTSAGSWVSITWNNMDQEDLSPSQKTEIISLLDSISLE